MEKQNLYELLKIGLTDGEAKVYLALHEIGSSSVGPIVKKSGVAYSNVYTILERLIKKGLVSFIIKEKTKHFQASPPHNLIDFLEKKEKQIQSQKKQLLETLPKLEKIQKHLPTQDAEIFIGQKGLKTAYQKLISDMKQGDEDLFFYIHEKVYEKDSDLFYFSIQDIFKKKKFPNRGIVTQNYKESDFGKQAKFLNMKFVNFPLPGTMDIIRDKVFFISWRKPITGVLIHSQSLADNFRAYFESVWKIAKK
ncbi:DUF3839 domain-containing protein [Candidatus Pacearchaeota archaeon]|nr:DUF3839 domain-containing protein [Candidatus Pacearchaeota archaeon]